jgi:ribosomal protein S18 acetylase RimI-like enzyme
MPADEIAIRPADASERAAILGFWNESAYGASPTDDDDGVDRLLARDAAALLVATDGARIVGTIIAGWDGWRANLYRLAVLDAYRRRGVGAMLVREAELRFGRLGARRISALVEVENERARAFWESQGYAVAESQMRYYKDVG